MSLTQAIGHFRFGRRIDARSVHDPPQQNNPDGSGRPFRLLYLPKEIRLTIYEKLDVVYHRHPVPLARSCHYGILINPSLDGIRVLQTCRLVYDEAGYMFRAALTYLSRRPATMVVYMGTLIALTSMGDYDTFQRNILERMLVGNCSLSVQSFIHDY
jgi:hypothetical protein